MMPGMDGWAVLTALKKDPELADIPVLMCTILDDRNMGFALGASEFLTKPIDHKPSRRRDRKIRARRRRRVTRCWSKTTGGARADVAPAPAGRMDGRRRPRTAASRSSAWQREARS